MIIIPTDRKICHFHYHSAYKHFCFTSKIINLPPYNLSHNFQCLYITNWYYNLQTHYLKRLPVWVKDLKYIIYSPMWLHNFPWRDVPRNCLHYAASLTRIGRVRFSTIHVVYCVYYNYYIYFGWKLPLLYIQLIYWQCMWNIIIFPSELAVQTCVSVIFR